VKRYGPSCNFNEHLDAPGGESEKGKGTYKTYNLSTSKGGSSNCTVTESVSCEHDRKERKDGRKGKDINFQR